MNIPNLRSHQQELDTVLQMMNLTPTNEALARTYMLDPDAKDSMLEQAEAQDFNALLNQRFAIAGKVMRSVFAGDPESSAKLLKLFWAIGGISTSVIWGLDGFGRMTAMDTFQWRCNAIGPVRAVYMEVRGMGGRRMSEDRTALLFEFAQKHPEILLEAQQLCGNADPNTMLLLGAMLLYASEDQSILSGQLGIVASLVIAGLKYVLPGMPMDQIRILADYIAKGDLTAVVPTPSFIQNPAVDSHSAQYAISGDTELLAQFSVAAFLSSKRDIHLRCALKVYLMLFPRQVFATMARALPQKLFFEALDLLRQDTPGGGVTLLLFLAENQYYYRNYGAHIVDRCRRDLPEAMRQSTPAQYLTLTELDDAELPDADIRAKLTTFFSKCVLQGKEEVRDFLEGSGDFSDIRRELASAIAGGYSNPRSGIDLLRNYLASNGWDDFACRCCAVAGIVCQGHHLEMICFKGQGQYDGAVLSEMASQLLRRGLRAYDIMEMCAGAHEASYNERVQQRLHDTILSLAEPANIADLCKAVKTGNLFLRSSALDALAGICAEPGAKEGILSAMGDSSKQIRDQLLTILPKHPEWAEDLKQRLSAKKAAERLLVTQALGKMGVTDALEAALAVEKNAKVADAIRQAIGASAAQSSASSVDELTERLLKGNKVKKLSWLVSSPLPLLHDAEGKEVSEDRRNAILLSYSELGRVGRSETAAELAAGINEKDLQALACEVYELWFAAGAQAKQKWVLAFAAVFGGTAMTPRLQKAINDWPNHQRGAIACDAVMALALSTDPAAIVIVDAISRKFKFRQVKVAAGAALENAAKELGISAEELADRIVPDLGFGKDGKRIFDYGKRSFTVRLTPTLELEITNDQGKAVKNLPAPGKTDDPMAAEAYESFKAMKKQIKATVSAQRTRLEAALSSLRCWTTERWEALFVGNPIMHQFAISLVWGIYRDGKLTDTFRYMEDGSFTTVDEDEYSLPENALIGLVHPVELDQETLEGWKQQLEDYEITQSLIQLERPVHRLAESRAGERTIEAFGGKQLNGLSLSGKLLGAGWLRGSVIDGGGFYDYYKEEAAPGISVQLNFSGSYVGDENDTVTVYDAVFYRSGTVQRGSYVYDKPKEENILPLGQIPSRCYSEILYQLHRATASASATDENWKQNRIDA